MSSVTMSVSEPAEEELDVVGEALTATRLHGSALYRSEMVAPWAIRSWTQEDLRAQLAPDDPNARVVMFHAVVEGEVEYVDHTDRSVTAGPGEIVLFAGGHQHDSRQGTPDTWLSSGGVAPGPWATLRFGDEPPTAVTLCGILVLRDTELNPLLEALPDMVLLPRDSRSAASFQTLVSIFDAPGPGRGALLDRAAEMLFILAVRDISGFEDRAPWFRAIEDPHVGRAIRAIHRDPAADWSVERLAGASGISRSGLAARFKATMQVSPARYLTRWRMYLATRMLRDRSASISEVAEGVGYASEFAFSRAFKRHLGIAPSEWRKR